jgi:hypothetical protein
LWRRWTTEVDRTVRAAADGDDLSGASAAIGGGGGDDDDDGRRGRTLPGKGREPARQRRHARGL